MIISNNINDAKKPLAAADFDLHTAVLSTKASYQLNTKLVPAKESTIIIEKGGYHITASSDGVTLLILPIEYSHCLDVTVLSGAKPILTRVDIALTGILFNKALDIKMDNRTGPLANPRCRFADYLEFVKLNATN